MEVIEELRKFFPGSVNLQDVDLPAVLAHINADTNEKFIIIIDEWDAIFREDKLDTVAQEATMINPGTLAEYVGFTEKEVHDLCEVYSMDFSETRRWYDGYSFRKIKHIYNPNSVVNAMLDKEFNTYWTQTETYESLKDYICINFDGLKESVVQMLAGDRCKTNPGRFQNDMITFHSKDDVLTLLIHLGYLAYDVNKKEVYIPNEEIKEEFKNAIEGTDWNHVINAIRASDKLLQATWEKDEDSVAAGIEKVHMENISVLEYNNENSLSCVISPAYYSAINEYTLIREMPAGKGYADIIFLPRQHSDKPAMIMELKYNKSVKEAISQIKEKQYTKALGEYKGNVLLGGINYDKQKKKYECIIEDMIWPIVTTHG